MRVRRLQGIRSRPLGGGLGWRASGAELLRREAHTGSSRKVSDAQSPDLVVFFLVTAVRAGSNLVGRTYL